MEKSWMPTVAGILDIICGCLALIGFLALLLFSFFFHTIPEVQADIDEFPLVFIRFAFWLGALFSLAIGGVALFGGVSTIQRRRWGWALAGAIASILICPPLGLAAIILVVMAERELRPAT